MGWGQDLRQCSEEGFEVHTRTGIDTGNKVQHMTTGAIQEKRGAWTSRWQGQRQRWEIGTSSTQPRQGLPWAGVEEGPWCGCSGALCPVGSHRILTFPKETFLNGSSHHSQQPPERCGYSCLSSSSCHSSSTDMVRQSSQVSTPTGLCPQESHWGKIARKSGLKAEWSRCFPKKSKSCRVSNSMLLFYFFFIREAKHKLLHQNSECSYWVSDSVWNPHCTDFNSNSGIDFNIFFHLLSYT